MILTIKYKQKQNYFYYLLIFLFFYYSYIIFDTSGASVLAVTDSAQPVLGSGLVLFVNPVKWVQVQWNHCCGPSGSSETSLNQCQQCCGLY